MWREIASCSTGRITGDRVQSSGNPHKMEATADRYMEIEREILNDIAELIREKKDVISVIEQLPVSQYDLLHKIYIGVFAPNGKTKYMTLKEAALACEMSYTSATTTHGRALQRVREILNERERLKQIYTQSKGAE